jgi:S-adenosylmethionine:tRNA ribosyltransferase-isomerase
MKTKDYFFDLPDSYIATFPLTKRSDSRLLVYSKDDKTLSDSHVHSITDYLRPNDLLIFNNSRVLQARLYGQKISGGRIECLIERVLTPTTCLCHIKGKHIQAGTKLLLNGGYLLEVITKEDALYQCKASTNLYEIMSAVGHMPLPPYMARADEQLDKERYQTVYANPLGSVAAPTAGLHFDETVFQSLDSNQIAYDFLTLHVGAGTFLPVRVDNIKDHKMHSEYCEVSPSLVDNILSTKAKGGRVIAVGTTTLRSLESAAANGSLTPFFGDTSIFIYPGFTFRVCDGLMTNFHLPGSSLLMLVSAFIGFDEMKKVYQHAVAEKYRFFSYGDASLLL